MQEGTTRSADTDRPAFIETSLGYSYAGFTFVKYDEPDCKFLTHRHVVNIRGRRVGLSVDVHPSHTGEWIWQLFLFPGDQRPWRPGNFLRVSGKEITAQDAIEAGVRRLTEIGKVLDVISGLIGDTHGDWAERDEAVELEQLETLKLELDELGPDPEPEPVHKLVSSRAPTRIPLRGNGAGASPSQEDRP